MVKYMFAKIHVSIIKFTDLMHFNFFNGYMFIKSLHEGIKKKLLCNEIDKGNFIVLMFSICNLQAFI